VGERMRKIPFCIPFEGGALKRNNWLWVARHYPAPPPLSGIYYRRTCIFFKLLGQKELHLRENIYFPLTLRMPSWQFNTSNNAIGINIYIFLLFLMWKGITMNELITILN
jgi:hypothetical protein